MNSYLIKLYDEYISVFEIRTDDVIPLKFKGETQQTYVKEEFWEIFKQKIQYESEELCLVLNSDRDDFKIDESIVVAKKQYFSGVDMEELIFDCVEKELGIFFAPEIEYSFDFESKTSLQEEEEIIENRSTHTDGVLQDYYKKKTLNIKKSL